MSFTDYDIDATVLDTGVPSLKIRYEVPYTGPNDGQFRFADPQTIDMSDAAVTLTVRRAASATQVVSNILYVDPNSSGASENLLLPPEDHIKGFPLFVVNTGGEGIAVQNDAGGAIATIPSGEFGFFTCDGTTIRGFVGLDAVTATSAEINNVADVSARLVDATGDLVATAASHSDRILHLSEATGTTVDLPAATGSGALIRVVVSTTVTSNNHIIRVAASTDDEFVGVSMGVDSDADTAVAYTAAAADNFDTITMDGTATGGLVGDWFEFVDIASGVWLMRGTRNHSGGSEAHGFSAAITS